MSFRWEKGRPLAGGEEEEGEEARMLSMEWPMTSNGRTDPQINPYFAHL